MSAGPGGKRKDNAVTGMLVACGRVDEFRREIELQPGEPTEDQSRRMGELFNVVLLAAAEYKAALSGTVDLPISRSQLMS